MGRALAARTALGAALALLLLASSACAPGVQGSSGGATTVTTPPITATPSTTPPAAVPGDPPTLRPTLPPPLTPDELRHRRAVARVDAMTPRELAAGVLMMTRPGTDTERLRDFVGDNALGGFILMGDNVPRDAAALRELTAAMTADPAFPPLIAIDQEGGEVSRLPWDDLPGADRLKREPVARTEVAFRGRAELLADAGVNVNFGIVADVPSGRQSFIFGRALGTSPKAAAKRVAAAVAGERDVAGGAVASTLKHFPGHGAAEGDSHLGVPSTELPLRKWRATHALPFRAGIDAGAELLMMGHLAFTAVDERPASLSKAWHRIARDELGFTGVIVSDDLGMLLDSGIPRYADISHDVVRSLAAGTDLALVIRGVDRNRTPEIIDAIEAAVASGELPAERLRAAATRVAELRLKLGEAARAE